MPGNDLVVENCCSKFLPEMSKKGTCSPVILREVRPKDLRFFAKENWEGVDF